MEKKPRLRAPNFTTSDNLLLCDIVAKYKQFIENKKIDGVSLLQKQKAWLEVVKEFNSNTSGYSRTLESLQQTYKNLKKKAKKHAFDRKMDISADRSYSLSNGDDCGTSGLCEWEKDPQTDFQTLTEDEDDKDRILKTYILRTNRGPPARNTNDLVLEKVKGLVEPLIDDSIYNKDRILHMPQNIKEEPNILESGTQGLENENDTTNSPTSQEADTQDEIVVAIDRVNLKQEPHLPLPRKSKLETENKQKFTERVKSLTAKKLELVGLQKELLLIQIQDERDKAAHNRSLREMQMEDEKRKCEHNEKIRKLELERYTRIHLFRIRARRHRTPRRPNHTRSA